MKPKTLFPPFLALVGMLAFATAASAQDTRPQDEPTEPAQKTAPAPPRSFTELDANADGAISKDEAAVDPALTQSFGTLDKDADGRLTPEEYAAYAQGTP